MTIAKDFAAKLAIAFVAVAMVLSAFAPSTQAQTTEELQAMINDLLAQVASLSGETSDDSMMSAGVCPLTWTRDLSTGSTGADVKALQQFLNANADTRVAASGVGSAGMETETFGPMTAAAVSKFQVMHRADVLTPAGLVNPTGYFGPGTRAKANSLCTTAMDEDMTDEDDSEDSDEDSEDAELSGEASLDSFEITSADEDELEEGAEDAATAELTVEFSDGDADISRIDVQILADGDANTSDVKPWDAFETVSLWVDGEMVSEMEVTDEDDYLDEDLGTIRFGGLNIVAMEDEEVDIIVAATIQNNLDAAEQTTWDFYVPAVRFFDADGVATTLDDSDDADIDTEAGLSGGAPASFSIDEAGFEDELIVKSSTNDPDAATLQVEDDAKSDWYTVFVFDLDTDDSTNDITINEIPVTVAVSSSTVATFFDDLELVVDGTTIDDFDWGADGATRVATFDVDGDVVIDAGARVEVELKARFKSLVAGNEGVTASGTVTTVNADAIDAEGSDTLADDQTSGSAEGDDHTLRTSGVDLSVESTSADVTVNDSATDDYGTYEIEFEVTAFEQDVFISTDPDDSISYLLQDGSGSTSAAGSRSVTLTSTADETGNYFEVTEGSSETFTLTVTYTPGAANTASRLVLQSVTFDDDAGSEDQTQSTLPATDWRTSVITMVN